MQVPGFFYVDRQRTNAHNRNVSIAGGTVVMMCDTFEPTQAAGAVLGRLLTYSPFVWKDIPDPDLSFGVLVKVIDHHQVLFKVNSFEGGRSSRHSTVVIAESATLIANWSNGMPLVAVKGRVVGLNFYPISSKAYPKYWNASTDGARLMANALLYKVIPQIATPTLALLPSSDVVALNATVQSPGGAPIQELGFVCVADNGSLEPTLETPNVRNFPGNFTVSATLVPATTTFACAAYATNEFGTAYTQTITVRPMSPSPTSSMLNSSRTTSSQTSTSSPMSGSTILIAVAAAVGVVVLFSIVAIVVLKRRRNRTSTTPTMSTITTKNDVGTIVPSQFSQRTAKAEYGNVDFISLSKQGEYDVMVLADEYVRGDIKI